MNQPIELLSVLYELSLTNLKHSKPEDTAKSFVNKFLSRRSLQAGSVWYVTERNHESLSLQKLFALPDVAPQVTINLATFNTLFKGKPYAISQQALLPHINEPGQYAYFKLNNFGLLVLYYNGSTNVDFSEASLLPFLDVIQQFAVSLESSFFKQKLQDEIAQRVAAEKSLKKNEEKYRRIIDNIELGLLEVDNDEIIQHANKSFIKLSGYSLNDLVGQKASKLLLDPQAAKTMQQQNERRKKGESGSYEIKIKDKAGHEKWAIISGAPNYDNEGNLIGSIGIHLDISAQKHLELENEFKTNQLEKLFEKSLDGLISINSKGEIFEWSPQAEKIFGFTKKEIIGKNLTETIVPHQHREAHEVGMNHYLATGHGPVLNNRIQITGINKQGREFPIELTIFPLEYKDEKYFTGFVRDITKEQAAQESMQQALDKQKELNSMKSQFISMTSHELRTPLTSIKSNTDLLSYHLEEIKQLDPAKLKRFVARIDNNVDRLNQLISNILTIGKLDSGKVPFSPVLMDVHTFLTKKVLADFASRGSHIDCHVVGTARKMELDEKLFTQIIINLIENAIKYSPDAPPPQVTLHYMATELEVQVRDFGIGIPQEELNKLFNTFYRASNVDNIQGTGLGLSIVKQFVEIHKGKIKIESAVGKGSTFYLIFPYTQIKHSNEL